MTVRRSGQIVAISLIAIVVTQILYMVTLGGPQASDPSQGVTSADIAAYFTDRWGAVATIWTVEALAFAAITACGFVAAIGSVKYRLAWVAVALAGVFNLVQIGIGLSLFRPAALAGEEYVFLFSMMVSGAFWFYFLAKLFIGLGALVFGLKLFAESANVVAKIAPALAVLTGLAAMVLNGLGLAQGNQAILYGGASGTLATLLAAIVCAMAAKREIAPTV